VEFRGERGILTDEFGNEIKVGLLGPDDYMYYQFALENTTAEPVTVTGFTARFRFVMHPARQAGYALDHCEQFVKPVYLPPKQTFPVVIAPGELMTISDPLIYHYDDSSAPGGVSNECQQGALYFGIPQFAGTQQKLQDPPPPSGDRRAPLVPDRIEAGHGAEFRSRIPLG